MYTKRVWFVCCSVLFIHRRSVTVVTEIVKERVIKEKGTTGASHADQDEDKRKANDY